LNYTCFCDGGYDNINKKNGYGSYVIFSKNQETLFDTFNLDSVRTSNQAEYKTFITLLEKIKEISNKGDNFYIYSDSRLMVEQINNRWKVNSTELKELNKIALDLINSLNSNLVLTWKPRKDIFAIFGH
jgi:ribonuclease HI